ncbi:MAG: N-acetylmuramoyl-L-alanine amidase [Pseudomonadota bacterium]
MIRIFHVLALALCVMPRNAAAQDLSQELSGLARVVAERSTMQDVSGGVEITLDLTQGVPFRVFTLAEPERLVMDFREVDWTGVDPEALDRADGVFSVRMGAYRPGWSRMVVDLNAPFAVATANAEIEDVTGAARLSVRLQEVDHQTFVERSGAPTMPGWAAPEDGLPPVVMGRQTGNEPLLVVLDPGHGGVDPGAERAGTNEKELMLRFARELQETLIRAGGFDVAMTRSEDMFVSLDRRVAIAHELGADVFVSLHADALTNGRAHGATVYTLSETASDEASAALAARHDRTQILAGIDLTHQDDVVADVLIDLARTETQPRSETLAKAIRGGIYQQNLPLNSRPLRSAGFSVLKSPDIPSVLVEIGFMSSERDLANIRDPDWRAKMAAAIRDALMAWRIADAASAKLVRQ